MEEPREEKIQKGRPLWTEEQWEEWIYSFAAEVEQEKPSPLFSNADSFDTRLEPPRSFS